MDLALEIVKDLGSKTPEEILDAPEVIGALALLKDERPGKYTDIVGKLPITKGSLNIAIKKYQTGLRLVNEDESPEKPEWYRKEDNRYYLMADILADYLAKSIPAFVFNQDLFLYENGVYRKTTRSEYENLIESYLREGDMRNWRR